MRKQPKKNRALAVFVISLIIGPPSLAYYIGSDPVRSEAVIRWLSSESAHLGDGTNNGTRYVHSLKIMPSCKYEAAC
jgi:hypothetical protein